MNEKNIEKASRAEVEEFYKELENEEPQGEETNEAEVNSEADFSPVLVDDTEAEIQQRENDSVNGDKPAVSNEGLAETQNLALNSGQNSAEDALGVDSGSPRDENSASSNRGIKDSRDDYFEDDEEFLKGDDSVLLSEIDNGILQQQEDVIGWELNNFYDESGKQRGRFALRSDPPTFRVRHKRSDGAEDVVEFVVSKQLAGEFEQVFKNVRGAYYGMTPKETRKADQASFRSYVDNVTLEAKTHPVRFAILVLFILATIFYLFIS